ncbi:MAG TPA: ABC transporter substrate-binding protein [Candidatus Methylomirabilis sp.]|nr:ABC transporter substrate-binding protein [Candidatus Methylomirabilis sp.]
MEEVSRRDFLNSLGVTVGAAVAASAGAVGNPAKAEAQEKPRGTIPDKPYKIGHMTFFTGPAAVLGEPSYKGHILAAEEINAQGGLLGKRKIETLKADEAAGTDANVKEVRRMKLQEKIDLFTGVISSGNTPALGPVAEELKLFTIFVDGCTDFLFDKAVPNPHYIFRITNIQSADGVTCAVAVATKWPQVRKIAHIHPDYSYGRNLFDHFNVAINKLVPGTKVVFEGWPKLGTTDFTSHITNAISAKPDLLVTGVWGGDYVAFYKQALRHDLFKKMKFATTVAFGVAPHAIGKDHPEGVIAGIHANYYFTNPPSNQWPLNDIFVKKYYDRWKEYPAFESEGGYVTLYMLKLAIERANKLAGGWPDDEAIISQLENLSMAGPAGYIYFRSDNHQAYKDAVIGFSKNSPEYPFQIVDPTTMITIPIRKITAPPGWPKGEPTSTYTWIEKTWPKVANA